MSEPRSELRLRDLGREAHDLVDLPDLGWLERRGRALRLRRQAGAVVTALVVAMTGAFLFQDRSEHALDPAVPPQTADADPWPGPQMVDIPAGTYELFPSTEPSDPSALVTVPAGWNSWQGPNRFNGHQADSTNDEAVARSTWIVGLLVLKVQGVATEQCQRAIEPAETDLDYDETVRSIRQMPGFRTRLRGSASGSAIFGYPTTRIHMMPGAVQQDCARDAALFATAANGNVGARGVIEAYVVDVEGTTMVVLTYEFGNVPIEQRQALEKVLVSTRFVVHH